MASQGSLHIAGPDGARENISRPQPPTAGPVHDLLCVGFGPASLAIAIALHDALRDGSISRTPNVLFLEKQAQFAWHAGMLLPGAKMQISFVKDLATLRDPQSHFTFLNYLHKNDRLVEFTNLSTFLPARIEYEDYLRWCASFFSDVVRYNNEVVSVVPEAETSDSVRIFSVISRNVKTGALTKYRARNVVLAVGGQPSIPQCLPASSPKVLHSSQYAYMVPKILTNKDAPYRVAVVGAGQSAAEIFSNIQAMYPNSKTSLVMKSEFLKPSDDSPFVNSIFNPEFVDALYPRPPQYRQSLISDAKATNYGVVRLELIEKLYELMYDQRREIGSDETKWPHRIMGGRRVVGVEENAGGLRLRIRQAPAGEVALEADGLVDVETQASAKAVETPKDDDELLDVDLIIAATGYRRNAHVEMLKDAWHLLPQNREDNPERPDQWAVRDVTKTCRVMEVSRDYRVQFRPGVVAPGSGVWLQGCCEGTHGLSDTLLSVLATRSGEMVKSIFGSKDQEVLRAHL